MTTAEITTQAIALAEKAAKQMVGYAYNAKLIEAKAAEGLAEGDAVQQGDVRIVYGGGNEVRRERRVDGEWKAETTMQGTDAQITGLLIQVACEAGRASVNVGA